MLHFFALALILANSLLGVFSPMSTNVTPACLQPASQIPEGAIVIAVMPKSWFSTAYISYTDPVTNAETKYTVPNGLMYKDYDGNLIKVARPGWNDKREMITYPGTWTKQNGKYVIDLKGSK